jgi:hypothetical protein
VPLPLSRTLTDAAGFRWYVTVDRGRLVLTVADGSAEPVVFDDPTDLRWFGLQLHRAAVEFDLDVQHAAAKASADRRLRRQQAGEVVGNRTRVFVEPPEPAMNLDPLVRQESA